MANKNKIKKNKNGDKVIFNKAIRQLFNKMTRDFIKTFSKEFSFDDITNANNWIIDNINQIEDSKLINECNNNSISKIINSMYDIVLSYSINQNFSNFSTIRDNLLIELSSPNCIPELLSLSSSKAFFNVVNTYDIFSNKNLKEANNNINMKCVQSICVNLSIFSLYILSFKMKFKNYYIEELKKDNDKYTLVYSKKQLLTNKEIADILAIDKIRPHEQAQYYTKILINIQNITVTYGIKNENLKEHLLSDIYQLCFKSKSLEFPFENKDSNNLLDLDDLAILPSNRKYGIFSKGIRFDFKDKSSGIDYLDMIETPTDVSFTINLKNYKEMYFLSNTDAVQYIQEIVKYKEEYNDDTTEILNKYLKPINQAKITLNISKDDLTAATNFTEISKSFNSVGISINKDSKESTGAYVNFIYISLICMYIAYYDHKLFSSSFTFKNINENERSSYKKIDSYRVAHLRKLPTGYKKSKEASLLAKKAGFDTIPEGYTFVEEHKANTGSKKIIKI